MTAQPESAPKGPIAYCTVHLDVSREEGSAMVTALGCVLNPDSTLVTLIPDTGTVQFNVTVPLSYGEGEPELAAAVEGALGTTYGVTGLSDVKFVPAL